MDYFSNARTNKISENHEKQNYTKHILYPCLITAIWPLNVAWKKEIHTINHSV